MEGSFGGLSERPHRQRVNACDNGWKLPLMLTGPGKLSMDQAIKGWVWRGGK